MKGDCSLSVSFEFPVIQQFYHPWDASAAEEGQWICLQGARLWKAVFSLTNLNQDLKNLKTIMFALRFKDIFLIRK